MSLPTRFKNFNDIHHSSINPILNLLTQVQILTLSPHAIYNHIAAPTLPNSPHTTSNRLDAYADRRAIIRTYFKMSYQLSSFTNTRAKQYHTFIIRNTRKDPLLCTPTEETEHSVSAKVALHIASRAHSLVPRPSYTAGLHHRYVKILRMLGTNTDRKFIFFKMNFLSVRRVFVIPNDYLRATERVSPLQSVFQQSSSSSNLHNESKYRSVVAISVFLKNRDRDHTTV